MLPIPRWPETYTDTLRRTGRPHCTSTSGCPRGAEWPPGDRMLMADHLSLRWVQGGFPIPGTPAAGELVGLRPIEPYDPAWRKRLTAAALAQGVPLRQGVYVGLLEVALDQAHAYEAASVQAGADLRQQRRLRLRRERDGAGDRRAELGYRRSHARRQ